MPKQTKYKVGDIVSLKSGGPDMTIKAESVSSSSGVITYTCQWFAGKKLESGSFPPESLELKQPEA